MPVQDKETLKGYFNKGDVPTESNYVDLIDSMGDGDMKKSTYDVNENGIVDQAANADTVDGEHASAFANASHTHPGTDITSIVDNADKLDGEHASAFANASHTHPGTDITSIVDNADKLDGQHLSNVHRKDQDIVNANDIDMGGWIDAGAGFRVRSQILLNAVMYDASSYLSNSGYDGDLKSVNVYTLTRAMFGWPSTAYHVYVKLYGHSSSGIGYLGINNDYTVYAWPLSISTMTDHNQTVLGWCALTAQGGDLHLRVGNQSAYVYVQIWGFSFR